LAESGEVFEVTKGGRSVARIVPLPLSREPTPQEIAEAIESADLLAEEISKYVPAGVTAEQIINDIRS
jgi:antitoxin (DNA-binding transcriptional repressor) of toxin-antitoxin stability system